MENFYCVVTFENTGQALAFEKTLKKCGFDIKLMPVPRQVSSSCGTSARVSCDKKDEILATCSENHLEIDGFHKITKSKEKNWFIKHLKKTTHDYE